MIRTFVSRIFHAPFSFAPKAQMYYPENLGILLILFPCGEAAILINTSLCIFIKTLL